MSQASNIVCDEDDPDDSGRINQSGICARIYARI